MPHCNIRLAQEEDLPLLLELLYTHLKQQPVPPVDDKLREVWKRILDNAGTHTYLGYVDGRLVCSCTLIIVDNLTHSQRPYALLENVVTHSGYQRKGFGTLILDKAREKAKQEGCYKIMLMTGSKRTETLDFYRKAGYNSEDKTGFVQWL